MAARFWLHVNHPNSKTRLHAADGCAWVRRAAVRRAAGLPYGEVLGNRNGEWLPFESRAAAEAEQTRASKADNADCALCFGR